MRKILISGLVFFIGFCADGQVKKESSRANEIPWAAFRLLTESTVDPCRICAKMKVTEATGVLVRKYEPGKIIASASSCGFTRTDECGVNEFVLSCYRRREMCTLPGGGKKSFPLLVFRFHTEKDHLAGILDSDYTDPAVSEKVNSLPVESIFNGEISVINFRYGDGPAFNIFMDKNIVLIHCRIISL